ncbi:hypothetical protein Adt_23194 [Abeliophyllum distichum]|uniref:Uncharacterized protein n=1 Tax=Abeliophyllum distichum TaxID=126358 RepID=A0ABD1SA67_9LAMI
MKTEGDLYSFNASSDSRSNPFEEGGDDAIHASHGPLLHWTQAKDHIRRILGSSERLVDQNKRETKFGGQRRRKSEALTMRSHGDTRLRLQRGHFRGRTLIDHTMRSQG